MRYLSQCPECQVVYQLSLSQINISDGRVRCAQCQTVFNALSHFVADPLRSQQPPPQTIQRLHTTSFANSAVAPLQQSAYYQYVTEYMHKHVDGSKLDLYTYLNHLNRINPLPNAHNIPTDRSPVHPLERSNRIHPRSSPRKSTWGMKIWGIFFILLLGLLCWLFILE